MRQSYSILEFVSLIFYFIYTKIFFPKARLVRFPIDVRGKNKIKFGKNLTTGKYCRLEAFGKEKTLFLGDDIQFNDMVHITASQQVVIGSNVLIASKVYISDTTHGNYQGDNQSHPDSDPKKRKLFFKPVEIQDNVWIGEFVSILPGVIIGKGSIVGANSVVTKDIPPFSIAVGSPAKIIKRFDFTENEWKLV